MFWLLLLPAIVVALLIWFLLSPLIIRIDTREGGIYFKWKSIGAAALRVEEEQINMQVNVFFLRFRWPLEDLFKKEGKKTKKKRAKHPKKTVRKKKTGQRITGIVRVIKAFRVKQFELALDTGDYTLNARLYPLNYYPLPAGKMVYINFLGKNYLAMKIVTAPWRILYAWLRK